MFSNASYAVVLRSFFSQPIAVDDIYGTVRDRNGSLLATVEDAYFAPAIIEPQALCIIGVSFDSELTRREQQDSSVELDRAIELDIAEASVANLAVTDFAIRPDRIIGVVENTTGSEVSLGWIVGVLLHGDGDLATWFSVTTDKWDLPAGETSTFSKGVELSTDVLELPYLVAAQGSAF
jgi:hypothetical protein